MGAVVAGGGGAFRSGLHELRCREPSLPDVEGERIRLLLADLNIPI